MNRFALLSFHKGCGYPMGRAVALAAAISFATSSAAATETDEVCGEFAAVGCLGASEYFAEGGHGNSPIRSNIAPDETPLVGLALAGGGTRASQISIGILKGLHEAGVLKNIRYLSTVSGGSYAGYWLVAQRHQFERSKQTDDDLFSDCIPSRYKDIAAKLAGRDVLTCTAKVLESTKACLCPSGNNFANVLIEERAGSQEKKITDPFRYQNHLRGHTDLFATAFSYDTTRSDKRFAWLVSFPLLRQIGSAMTVDFLGDTVFDWNVNSSPSRNLYKDGIRRIYGLPPLDCADYLSRNRNGVDHSGRLECMETRSLVDENEPRRNWPLPRFEDLREAHRTNDRAIPFWVINATTPVLNCPKAYQGGLCVPNEFLGSAPYPPHKATFEFTPTFWGAGEFGYWPVNNTEHPFGFADFSVTDAVASSAAFFDPNEKSITAAGLFNVLQQTTGFRWGHYLENPRVSTGERIFHRFLFFPFYFAHRWRETKDAVDIHLIDGGQSDNLGAYALIRRRIPNIIISDHAGEGAPGNMEDVCRLKRSLSLPEFARQNGGRIWHVRFDDLADLDKVCDENVDAWSAENPPPPPTAPLTKQPYIYSVWNWTHPVVRGCAVEIPWAADAAEYKFRSCANLREKYAKGDPVKHLNLFLIKPAINLQRYAAEIEPERLGQHSYVDEQSLVAETEIQGFIKDNLTQTTGGGALLFPTHSTVKLTIDSSPWLFGAYRELAAAAARTIRIDGKSLKAGNSVVPVPQIPLPRYLVEQEAYKMTEMLKGGGL